MEGSVKIKIKRRANYMGFLRAFKIYVDGNKLGTVSNGKEVELEIAPGQHRIDILGALWAKTQILDINAQPGERLSFECGVEPKYIYYVLGVIFLSFLGKPLAYLLHGGRWLALIVALCTFIASMVLLVRTFQRGQVYFLKQDSPGARLIE